MTRSNVVLTRQPPQMKLPDHPTLMHQSLASYHSPLPQHHSSASVSHSSQSDLHSTPDNLVQHSYVPPYTHDNHQTQTDPVKNEQLTVPDLIPNSVKGAPAHLRPAIRKRQNSESAKRSRQRRKEAAKIFYRKFDEQCARLTALEGKVANLIQLVKEADEESSPHRAKQEHDIIPDSFTSTTPTDAGAPKPTPPAPHTAPEERRSAEPIEQQAIPDVSSNDDYRAHVPFEDDLEALLETCIHSQHMFGAC